MVNDLLNRHYLIVSVRHWMILLRRRLTSDKYCLSEVIDLRPQISENGIKERQSAMLTPDFRLRRHFGHSCCEHGNRRHRSSRAAVLPIDRRDKLAEILTDQDLETLKHLVNEGMGDNTLRALASDLAYLGAWCLMATEGPLPWPAPEALLLKFVAHHLWDPARRETDPKHGMPAAVEQALRTGGFLRTSGPHAPATVGRRLANWSTLTKWRGRDGAFGSPALKSSIRLAIRAAPRQRLRKSAKAVTSDVLAKLLATCGGDNLRDLRDRAILMVAFASCGRRRSEIAGLRKEQLTIEQPVAGEDGNPLPSLSIHLVAPVDELRAAGCQRIQELRIGCVPRKAGAHQVTEGTRSRRRARRCAPRSSGPIGQPFARVQKKPLTYISGNVSNGSSA
ncbi:integrase [Rhizobium redzepovicii]